MTCSSECAKALSQENLAQAHSPESREENPEPKLPEGCLTGEELAVRLSETLQREISVRHIGQWRRLGKIAFHRQGESLYYVWDEVLPQIQSGDFARNQATLDDAPKKEDSQPSQTFSLEQYRKKMLRAAKEAARDECLREADRAKASGDHKRQAQCLEDYIQLEEGLTLIFQERR